MKHKKLFGLLVAGVMLFSSAVGCSSGNGKQSEQTPNSTATDTQTPAATEENSADEPQPQADETQTVEAGGEVEVVFWHHWQSEQRRPTITAIVDKFNEENVGKYNVVSTPIPWADFDALFMAAIASKDVPDVVVRPVSNYIDYAQSNMVEDITDYLPEDVLEKYDENFRSYAKYDDKIYALPFNTDDYIMYYNKQIFEDAGVTEIPETWDDIWNIADKIDKKDANGNYEVVAFFPGLATGIGQLMDANGGGFWDNPLNPTKIQYNDPKNVEAMEFAKKWSDRYGTRLWTEYSAIMNQNVATETNDIFVQGKVSMVIEASNYATTVTKYGPDMNLGAFPIPAGPSANGNPRVSGGGFSLFVPKGCKNLQAAAAYADFMTDDWASAKWGIDQHEIMTNKTVKDSPELQSDELFKVALSVVPSITIGIAPKGLSDRRAIEDEMRDNIMGTNMSAQEALDLAQEAAEDLWEQNLALGVN